jgi:hypothetical protein
LGADDDDIGHFAGVPSASSRGLSQKHGRGRSHARHPHRIKDAGYRRKQERPRRTGSRGPNPLISPENPSLAAVMRQRRAGTRAGSASTAFERCIPDSRQFPAAPLTAASAASHRSWPGRGVTARPAPRLFYSRMKNASDAAAITPVAAQPQIAIARDTVNRPITFGLRTISIITAISGAASTPLTTAAQ